MKMYILVKRDVPDNFVPVITAHSSLACYLKFENDPDMIRWVNGIFKKVVCVVNDKEFENSKQEDRNLCITESSLDGREVAMVFCPREKYSKQFKYFQMWTPKL